jgi:hypothetical protein
MTMLSASHASTTLKSARDAVLKDWNYDSDWTRRENTIDWQLDAAEALYPQRSTAAF